MFRSRFLTQDLVKKIFSNSVEKTTKHALLLSTHAHLLLNTVVSIMAIKGTILIFSKDMSRKVLYISIYKHVGNSLSMCVTMHMTERERTGKEKGKKEEGTSKRI